MIFICEAPIDAIELATLKPKHLVHRGGKKKDGNAVVVTDHDLDELIDNAMAIGENIHLSLENAINGESVETNTDF
ncbi:hypothetical protein K5Y32_11275 [Pantoea sp. DY-15]|uniref:hypothetical protein n=1 Tax=Pantoea sp. DY-15 TaxID=2871489 RepID=UPI001C97FC00|nr:hypothetical protein [Pantoea sp. DY-15]MBY4888525.1 hypothetical protein [Pantoea sp. DY-15]